MSAAQIADELLAAAAEDRLLTNSDPQWPRAMADLETGKDQLEPHQITPELNCWRMSTGELRDVLLYSSDPKSRSRAMSIFEERIRTEGFREAAAGALSAIAGRR